MTHNSLDSPTPLRGESFSSQLRSSDAGHCWEIDGKPTLLLGGQLHNSTPSDLAGLPEVFSQLKRTNASFAICGVSWAVTEPVEGQFDFAHVDVLLETARRAGLRLILIWFGAFKNAKSTYSPTWVRRDTERFPRAHAHGLDSEAFTYEGAMSVPVLSVFSPELRAADSRAYQALATHLAARDLERTVVMLQIQNEVGLLGDSRDRCALASSAWAEQVPQQLTHFLSQHRDALVPELRAVWARGGYRTSGSWAEVFGDDWEAEEIFMAWAFASYIEALATVAAPIHGLPQYANVWLGPQPGQERAGQYPSGGAGARVIDVYEDDAKSAMAPYVRPDNPLFIPESRFRTGQIFWAIGEHNAIGYSVFGIEDGRIDRQLAAAYEVLGEIAPVITQAQAEGRIAGILLEDGEHHEFSLGGFRFTAQGSTALLNTMLLDAGVVAPPVVSSVTLETREGAQGVPGWSDTRAFGIVIQLEDDTFLVVGQDLALDAATPGQRVEIDRAESVRLVDGEWQTTRILNGDERLQLLPHDAIGAVRIVLLSRPEEA